MSSETAKFADALASVETLSVEDQAALVEVVMGYSLLLSGLPACDSPKNGEEPAIFQGSVDCV